MSVTFNPILERNADIELTAPSALSNTLFTVFSVLVGAALGVPPVAGCSVVDGVAAVVDDGTVFGVPSVPVACFPSGVVGFPPSTVVSPVAGVSAFCSGVGGGFSCVVDEVLVVSSFADCSLPSPPRASEIA